jgi:cobalt/nickel transport system permease protein
MHIPDNYLSPSTDLVLAGVMVPVWAHCIRHVRRELDRGSVAFMGVAAAFSFLLMMFNVPLPGGTTGHAVGGTLVAILLGPQAACLAVSVALALQALLFGDGGILAFGANCLNMAFVLPFVGYAVYRLVADHVTGAHGERVAMALGAYAGIVVASLAAAVEFGVQPLLFHDASGLALYCPYPLSVSIPAMVVPHLLVAGPIEAVATVTIASFVRKVAPDVLPATRTDTTSSQAPEHSSLVPVGMLMATLVVATPLGLLAQGDAWGEWGVDELVRTAGLAYVPQGMADGLSLEALMPDYSLAGLPAEVGYVISAVIGMAVLVMAFKVASLAARPRTKGQAA